MLPVTAWYEEVGPWGVRDRASNRRIDDGRRERILKLYWSKYEGFGPTLAVAYLD